jgi:hypothetical protein
MTRKRLVILFTSVLTFALVLGWLSGAGYAHFLTDATVDWFVIASSGGVSSGSNITMESTVGQPIVGSSSGGNITFDSGYKSGEEMRKLFTPIILK